MASEQQNSRNDLAHSINTQRSRNLDRLRSRATTSSQRTALATYISIQKQAGSVRQTAVTKANSSFTEALKRYVGNRQATQAGQVEALRINLDDALQAASAQCAADEASADVAAAFTKTVQTSKQTYQTQRKADSAIIAQVQDLSVTRRQAEAAANQAYNSTMRQARNNLQAALK